MQFKIKTTVFLFAISSLFACKTMRPVKTVDNYRKEVHLYSSSDDYSKLSPKNIKIGDSLTKTSQALDKNPNDVQILLNASQLHLVKGNLAEAEKYAKQVLGIEFKNVRAKKILAHVTMKKGNIELAKTLLHNLGGENSKDSEVLNLLALIELKKSNPSRGLYLFKKGLEHNPNDISIRMNLGSLYLKYRQLHLAGSEFERVLKVTPNHLDAKINLAVVKMSKGKLQEAKTDFEAILDIDKENLAALYNYSSTLFQMQQYDDSSKYLKKYIALIPEDAKKLQMAFNLADQLKQAQSEDSSISNEDIQELSKRMANSDKTKPTKGVASNVVVTDDAVEASESAPEASEPTPVTTSASEDEEDLEAILQN